MPHADPYAERGNSCPIFIAALILRHGGFVWPYTFSATVFQPGFCSTRSSIVSTCQAIGGSIVPSSALSLADTIAHNYSRSAKSGACSLSLFLRPANRAN